MLLLVSAPVTWCVVALVAVRKAVCVCTWDGGCSWCRAWLGAVLPPGNVSLHNVARVSGHAPHNSESCGAVQEAGGMLYCTCTCLFWEGSNLGLKSAQWKIRRVDDSNPIPSSIRHSGGILCLGDADG